MPLTTKFLSTSPTGCRAPSVHQSCLQRSETVKTVKRTFLRSVALHEELLAPKPELVVPFRKQLKDEARRQKQDGKAKKAKHTSSRSLLDKWELTVGIEIHAELNTTKKLFSSAATSVNDSTNAHVAHFDVAIPGTQPRFQTATVIPALRAALALNCNIQRKSTFDRKHYFYQDQPAGYQITQYYGMGAWLTPAS